MAESVHEAVLAALRNSRKYGDICEATLDRIAGRAGQRHPRAKEALKAAKRKLHQACGAYLDPMDLDAIDRRLASVPTGAKEEDLLVPCLDILRRHASTVERIPLLNVLYRDVFAETGPPRSILDIACGLNPFTLPWMKLPPSTPYHAVDIDRPLLERVQAFLSKVGRAGSVACRDVLVTPPTTEVDVVFLLKALPCIEQQERGAAVRLLGALRARYAVVSFPARSLGGRDKGMPVHYGDFMKNLMDQLKFGVKRLAYSEETCYICTLRRYAGNGST